MTNAEIVRRRRVVQEWREVHGDWCPACGRHDVELSADHVVPFAVSGDEGGELQVMCRSCNSRKGARG
jgi:5-methylcytosine-specific restriction enzyme A